MGGLKGAGDFDGKGEGFLRVAALRAGERGWKGWVSSCSLGLHGRRGGRVSGKVGGRGCSGKGGGSGELGACR